MPIGPEFIHKTKYPHLGRSNQQKGLPQPPLEDPFTGGAVLELPLAHTPENPLKSLIEQRASLRAFRDEPLTQAELSFLLWATQGIKRTAETRSFRNVPSAGGRHAFETYLLANSVEGLPPGIYRYLAFQHKLQEFIMRPTIGDEILHAAHDQEFIRKCAAVFMWVAVVERMTWRYEQRGYRYLFLDAGHVCQNLYLAAESIGCGACAVAAFEDDDMNALLRLDGENQFLIYMGTVGKPRKR